MSGRRGGRRSLHGSQIKSNKVKICAGCEGYLPANYKQCPACGRIDTITFDSMAELKRFGELRLLEKAGQISSLVRQPKFALSAGGQRIGHYIADFRYIEGGREVVEDVKGGDAAGYVDTSLGRWKRKHCEAEHGLTVSIIKR